MKKKKLLPKTLRVDNIMLSHQVCTVAVLAAFASTASAVPVLHAATPVSYHQSGALLQSGGPVVPISFRTPTYHPQTAADAVGGQHPEQQQVYQVVPVVRNDITVRPQDLESGVSGALNSIHPPTAHVWVHGQKRKWNLIHLAMIGAGVDGSWAPYQPTWEETRLGAVVPPGTVVAPRPATAGPFVPYVIAGGSPHSSAAAGTFQFVPAAAWGQSSSSSGRPTFIVAGEKK